MLILGAYIYSQTLDAASTFTYHHVTMDTMVELRFQSDSRRAAEEIRDQVFAEIERLEKLFSRTIEESDVVAVNRQAGRSEVAVSPEVFYVVEQSLYYAGLSEGAFDPTVAPLVDLWGFMDDAEQRVPEQDEISRALNLVDYRLVEILPAKNEIFLPVENMALELGGIAKGYIVDRTLEVLDEAGVEHAFVNAGGDIGLIGTRPDGEPWRIGVRNPRLEQELIAIIPGEDMAVVTSGDYERTFEKDGVKYHHILDPESGKPARYLAGVTITAPTALKADVLSTAVFVLGPEKGMELIESLGEVEGILITPELDIYVSSGLEDAAEIKP